MSEPRPKRRGGRPRASAERPLVPTIAIDKALLGPAMAALPNDRWRAAAVARFMVKTNTAAMSLAGFGADVPGGPTCMKQQAYDVFHDERMLRALKELGEKHLVAGIPNAIGVVEEIMSNPEHKDRLRAAQTVLDRAYPLESLHRVTVEHKIDYQAQALEELTAFRKLGVAREKLEEIFGRDGLYHLEQQLDASKPKVIEHVP
jgi:hypothetical protein